MAPYHAASSGLAERNNPVNKTRCQHTRVVPISYIHTYRSATHSTTGYAAKLFLGRELRTRLSLIKPQAQSDVIMAQGKQKDYHDLCAKYRKIYLGDAILI